ncbi:hypothetical protein KR044_009360, partial [Drosophila immigrans]
IVLDVGCRSGLLSFLACKAGAARVFAVGNALCASSVAKALVGHENAKAFRPLPGCISQTTLPTAKVDIIVSEWMGDSRLLCCSHGLLADSLYSQVSYARDKWLVPGGRIIPNHVSLFIQGISDHARTVVEANSRPLSLVDDYADASKVMTDKYLLTTIDLMSAKPDDEFIKTKFKLRAVKSGSVAACLLVQEVASIDAQGRLKKLFSNGPKHPRTYMKQTVLFLDVESIAVNERNLLSGRFCLALSNFAPRGVEYSLAISKLRPHNL